jgi:hypothetical protein
LAVVFREGLEVRQNYKDTRICATHIKRHTPPVLCSTDGGGVFVVIFLGKRGKTTTKEDFQIWGEYEQIGHPRKTGSKPRL